MPILLSLILALPSLVLANDASMIRIHVPAPERTQASIQYWVILDPLNPQYGEILQTDGRKSSKKIYEGLISAIDLPIRARVDNSVYGQIYTPQMLYTNYDLFSPNEAGLRIRAGDRLVLLGHYGAISLPWLGHLKQALEVDSEVDDSGLEFVLLSLKGSIGKGLYLAVSDDFSSPYFLAEVFADRSLGAEWRDKKIWIDLMKKSYDPKVLREKQRNETLPPVIRDLLKPLDPYEQETEQINLLSYRDLWVNIPDSEIKAAQAIRILMIREFPWLSARTNAGVKQTFEMAAGSLAKLWKKGILPDAESIKSVIEKRLEILPAPGDRLQCELSLIHDLGRADDYERGKALRALNSLRKAVRP